MRRAMRAVLVSVTLWAAVAMAEPAAAQTDGTMLVQCNSRGGNRATCRADLRDGILMERQLSNATCEFGVTWGIHDARSFWVDQGCRADFRVRAPRGWDGGPADEAYRAGYTRGASDRRANRSRNPLRYRDEYHPRRERDFTRGYEDGYDNRREVADTMADLEKAYKAGRAAGSIDRRAGRPSDYRRYDRQYDARNEREFKRGYEDGYERR